MFMSMCKQLLKLSVCFRWRVPHAQPSELLQSEPVRATAHSQRQPQPERQLRGEAGAEQQRTEFPAGRQEQPGAEGQVQRPGVRGQPEPVGEP